MSRNEPIRHINKVFQDGMDEIVVTAPLQSPRFFDAGTLDFINTGPDESYVLAYDHTSRVGVLYASGPSGEPAAE
ncbi:hypothetical protein [uncultured Tateyamaria sp.]|uniref:hypothetical protein n=1 Tax=uncultured Tateyamaria sp. TaxID=455651 RepID=UPI00262722DC|nr:hypothetical protein [uncultured Tateyamaria sp.]